MKTLEDALAAIEAMKTEHADEKAAILRKNAELIDREKAAKTAADAEKTAREEAEAAREEASNEAASKAGDVETVKAALERKHAREITKLNNDIAALTSEISVFKIDDVITKAMTEHKVHPDDLDLVRTFLKAGSTMKDNVATVGDKPLDEHIGEFFASPTAKRYLSAPQNSGADAAGSTTRTHSTLTKAPTNETEMATFGHIVRENPEQAKALAKGWGWPELNI